MRTPALIAMAAALVFPVGVDAQGRRVGRDGVPPGHMPRPGECRVWYDGRPPGQQPAPVDCRTAEEIARRDRYARVIYGDQRDYRSGSDRYGVTGDGSRRGEYRDGRYKRTGRGDGARDRASSQDRNRGRTTTGRAVPRGSDEAYGGYERGDVYAQPGLDAGYRDGVVKGREDASKGRRYEPNRHSWYKSGTRGYDRSLGSKDAYVDSYREAFTRGYAAGFRSR